MGRDFYLFKNPMLFYNGSFIFFGNYLWCYRCEKLKRLRNQAKIILPYGAKSLEKSTLLNYILSYAHHIIVDSMGCFLSIVST